MTCLNDKLYTLFKQLIKIDFYLRKICLLRLKKLVVNCRRLVTG